MNESSNYSLDESAAGYDAAQDLHFPDWSGQIDRRSRMSVDQWLAYCQSNLPRLRKLPGYVDSRLQDGIAVEFVL